MKSQQLSTRFVTRQEAENIALGMQNLFLVGPFTSQSRVPHIAERAAEHLEDAGIFPKRSLCLMIAKIALTMWIGTIQAVKTEQANS